MSIQQSPERRCNACGGALKTRLDDVKDPQTRESFAILGCVDCGLGHTSPQCEDLEPYYGSEYYGDRHSFTKTARARLRWRLVERAAKKMPIQRKPALLDVGCGEGSFLQIAQENGWRVMGTELSANSARAASLGIDVRESLESVAASGPFDVITMWHSLEHFRDPKATLEQLRGMLAPRGALVIAVPNAGGAQATLFREHWFHLDVPRHLFHFDVRSLAALIDATGFHAESWHHLELEQELFGWVQSALNRTLPQPNVLFRLLTGASAAGKTETAMNYVAGAALGALAIPAMTASVLSRRGATMTVLVRGSEPGAQRPL